MDMDVNKVKDIISEIEDILMCPISKKPMRNPATASDGYTYEATSIKQAVNESLISPKTGKTMKNAEITPNATVKSIISCILRYKQRQVSFSFFPFLSP